MRVLTARPTWWLGSNQCAFSVVMIQGLAAVAELDRPWIAAPDHGLTWREERLLPLAQFSRSRAKV